MTNLRETYDYLLDLLRGETITAEDIKDDQLSGKASKIFENMHDAQLIETMAAEYVKKQKAALLNIYETENTPTKTVKQYNATTVKYVAKSNAKKFDTTRFRKEHPELAEEYTGESARRGHVEVSFDE